MDEARPARPGEELDADKLGAYLRAALGTEGPLEILQFPGGHSNLTYLVSLGGRELVLRRPPFGSKVKSAHDMGREYRVLSHLAPVYPRAPRPLLFCDDDSVIGARFYVMERIRGVIVRREPPPGFPLGPEAARRLSEAFVDTLVELHALDYRAIGLGDFGNPEGFVERQVSGWTRRWQDARTDEVVAMEELAAWLAAHRPPSPPATLIHNDYKHDNLVLDDADAGRIVGILDWEMATIGDPLIDLGTALCYWIEAGDPDELKELRFGPTTLPGSFTRREVAERYAAASGRDVSHLGFYYAFGLFKTAVVVQQIYARFRRGLTQDARFASFGQAAAVLARQAVRSLP